MSLRSGPPTFVCVRNFQWKLSKATLPFATFMANDPQGPQTTRCWWMAVKPCRCLVYLIVFGIISNQNNHFKSTFPIFQIPGISNMLHVHSPLFLTSITSILSKDPGLFLGHGCYTTYLGCTSSRLVVFLWESWAVQLMVGPLEVEEAIKAQIRRRHPGSDEDPTFFFCQGDFLPSKNPLITRVTRVNTRV